MLTLNVRKRSTNNCCARNIVKFCIVIADTEISGKSTLFHWTVFIRRQRKWRTRRSQSWEGASRTWARSPWRNSTNRRWFRQNQKTWSAPPDQVSQIAKSNYFSLLTKKIAAGKEEKSRRSSSQQTPESMSSQQAMSRMSPYTSSRLASSNYMQVAKKSSSSSGSSAGSGSKNNKLNNEDASLSHQVQKQKLKYSNCVHQNIYTIFFICR